MREVQAKRAGLKTLTMLGIMLLLSGCAGVNLNPLEWFNSDEEINPPKELVDISAEVRLDRLWSVDVGNGQDNH